METAIIINFVFVGLVSISVILYLVWVGRQLVKLTKRTEQILKGDIEGIHRKIDNESDGIARTIDRLDSRLDKRIKESMDYTDEQTNIIRSAIDDLVRDVDDRFKELNK